MTNYIVNINSCEQSRFHCKSGAEKSERKNNFHLGIGVYILQRDENEGKSRVKSIARFES